MTLVGSAAAAACVLLVSLALRGSTRLERRLRAIAGSRGDDRRSHGGVTPMRAVASLAGLLAGALIGGAAGVGPLLGPAGAYAGWVAPTLLTERAAAARRRDAERAVVGLVERLHALLVCGRPVESALASLATRPTGSAHLDASLSRVHADYLLGVPLHAALRHEGTRSDIGGLAALADRLERARELGRGAVALVGDLRDELRARERAVALERASQVEGKLTLVLTLCYLPALALLVIVPLFLTLLAGLFG